jgi:glycosyltransferase 2 family protein
MAMTFTGARLKSIAVVMWRDVRLRRVAMAVLLGLSLIFLVRAFVEAGSASVLARIDGGDLILMGVYGLAYGVLLVLLAQAWSLTSASDAGFRKAVAVYGTSVLLKYFPGSVLQYGSRQVLGARLGWDATSMAQGSVLEIALHVISALAVALVLIVPTRSSGELTGFVPVLALALAIAIAVLIFISRRLDPRIVLGSALYQLGFFAGMAALAALSASTFGAEISVLPAIGGLFLLAWLIGFVMPFAPGGIGIREAAGVALLTGITGLELALLIVAAMRVVSLIGDVLIFVAGLACQRSLGNAR